MPAIDLGSDVAVSWTPGTTGGTVVLAVQLPDTTVLDPAPVIDEATGVYSGSVPTTQPGRYLLNWLLTDPSPAKAYADVFDVWPADPRFLVPLAEMVSAVRQTTAVSASDASDMRLFIAAATPVIEDIVGAVLIETKTQYADGGKTGVALHERAATVISVTVNNQLLTVERDYVVDDNAAIVYAGGRQSPRSFQPGRLNVEIVYTVGSSIIKPNIRLATIELVRHMWQLGRQTRGAALPGETAPQMGYTPSGFAVPNRVLELCAPDVRKDGL